VEDKAESRGEGDLGSWIFLTLFGIGGIATGIQSFLD
jgi:hypothetical protein